MPENHDFHRGDSLFGRFNVEIQTLASALNQGLLLLSKERGEVLEANALFSQMLGVDRDSLSGVPLDRFFRSEDAAAILSGTLPEYLVVEGDGDTNLYLEPSLLAADQLGGDAPPGFLILLLKDIGNRIGIEQELEERRLSLQLALDAAGMGTWYRYDDRLVWDANMCAIFGVETAPSNTEKFLDFVHPEDRDMVRAQLFKARETGVFDEKRCRIQRPDGGIRQVLVKGDVIRDEQERIRGIRGVVTDITDRISEALAQQRKEAFLKQSQRIAKIAGFRWNMKDHTAEVSEEFYRMTGLGPESFIPTLEGFLEIVYPEDKAKLLSSLDKAHNTHLVPPLEFRIIRADGHIRMIHARADVFTGGEDENLILIGTLQDITKRKVQEAENERLISIIENARDFICIADTDGKVLYLNQFGRELLGYEDGIENLAVTEFFSKDSVVRLYQEGWPCARRDGTWVSELELCSRSGKEVTVSSRILAHGDDDRVEFFSFICRDLTPLLNSQAMILDKERRTQVILRTVVDAVITFDQTGVIANANDAAGKMFGVEPEVLLGRSIKEFLYRPRPGEQANPLWSFFSDPDENLLGRHSRGSAQRQDGSRFPILFGLARIEAPAGSLFTCVIRDLTHEEELERQLRHAQKMEAVGTLAGGISHDFNNILQGVIMAVEMAREVDPEAEQAEILKRAELYLKRGRDLTRQILTFSRRESSEFVPVNVSRLAKEVVKLVRAALPARIKIEHNIENQSLHVAGNPAQIHQLLMNLCTNAGQAMEGKGGKLSLSLSPTKLESSRAEILQVKPGTYLEIRVSDTGCGIGPEIQDRIFEPFFTTKAAREGTGLGLSVVHGVVRDHLGAVTFTSKVGEGTTFVVCLPLLEYRARTAPEKLDRDKPAGKGRILVVDDEVSVAEMLGEALSRLGYQVEIRYDGEAALELFSQHPEQYDLVFADLTMPNLDGLELSRALVERRPDIPVVLASGFRPEIGEKERKQGNIKAFLPKPYEISVLAKTLKRVLES